MNVYYSRSSAYIKETESIGIIIPQTAFATFKDINQAEEVSFENANEDWRTVWSRAKRNRISIEIGLQ